MKVSELIKSEERGVGLSERLSEKVVELKASEERYVLLKNEHTEVCSKFDSSQEECDKLHGELVGLNQSLEEL